MITFDRFNSYQLFNCDVQPVPKGNRGSKAKLHYLDLVCAFDIETTLIKDIEQSVMYIWQFQIGEYETVIGRTWNEFLEFCKNIQTVIHSVHDRGTRLVVYVHNLSYEFQFLSGVYPFAIDEVFCLDSRKIAKCEMLETLEFRCSYIHSNMSLDAFTHKMGVECAKLHNFDYDKERYFYSDLSQDELDYCINDVKGLVQAITIEMEKDGDDLYSIPLTSTGYVRRDFKKAMREVGRFRIVPLMPSWDVYEMLREAFRGGNTHANRYMAGFILDNVSSADRSSSYPEVQCNRPFPVTAFTILQKEQTQEDIEKLIYKRGKAVIMRVKLVNIELNNDLWGCPYLSMGKCRDVKDPILDNGRILSAESLETTITDIDYKIIKYEYHFKMTAIQVAHARYGELPEPMTRVIKEYYRRKTELKGVDDYYYMKAKNKLNSVYECTAQDPVKVSILYDEHDYIEEGKDPKELLNASNRKAFIPYQWGVWCTAWARYELEEGIKLAHGENSIFVYCDTDSVKYTGTIDWAEYNNSKIKKSKDTKAFAKDRKGATHYMGVYEQEKTYKRFKTLGAKKYAYEYEDEKTHITVAGVPKVKGADELEKAGGLKQFREGFIFRAGKMMSVYNDNICESYTNKDGVVIEITKNVALLPTEYHLGITKEYEEILEDAHTYKKALTILRKSGIIKE